MTTTKWSDLKRQADDATRPVPDDWYDLLVTKSEQRVASTGSQMVICQFRIETGPSAGKTLFNNFVFSPDSSFALNLFFEAMAAFGLGDEYFAELERLELDAEDSMRAIAETLDGRRVRAYTTTEQWQGRDRNRPSQWTAPATPNPRAVPTRPSGGPGSGPPVPGAGGPSVPPVGAGTGGPPVPQVSVPSAPAAQTPGTSTAPSGGSVSAPPPVPSF